jgi:hypothetical protein
VVFHLSPEYESGLVWGPIWNWSDSTGLNLDFLARSLPRHFLGNFETNKTRPI